MKTLMKPLTHSLSPLYLLAWLFTLSLFSTTPAADLKFDPATPIVVEINQTITLSVSGTVGQVRWMAFDGKIEGDGNQVTYFAPAQVGKDTVTVKDSVGSATVEVIITPPNVFSLENANWEVFTDRTYISALAFSNKTKTLWVGTQGGLEQWDVQGGKFGFKKAFTKSLSGLPDNWVTALLGDSQGGLWVGTEKGGLAFYNPQGQWQVFHTKNSGLPDNWVTALLSDSQDGLWVGTAGGLANYSPQGRWQVLNTKNSKLPDNWVTALLSDNQGGLWVGTMGGLAHYIIQEDRWQVFQTQNSGLPDNAVTALQSDSHGGLWVGTGGLLGFGTEEGGLAYYDPQGQWQVFRTKNSDLPGNWVTALQSDTQGGLWVGTEGGGLAHYNPQGQWQVFLPENSGLPNNFIRVLLNYSYGQDELLVVGTERGLAYNNPQNQWQVLKQNNSDLPDNWLRVLQSDGQNGLWVGTFEGGLAHRLQDASWQVFNFQPANSVLTDSVDALESDSEGGLWAGISEGRLVYYSPQGKWQTSLQTKNFGLPDRRDVTAILSKSKDELWVGTENGLARLSGNQWQVLQTENSDFHVTALSSDNQDGVWVGTSDEGLAHYSPQGEWQVFKKENSRLPDNFVQVLLSDGQDGVWVGTSGGLAYYSSQGEWQVFHTENSDLPDNKIWALRSDNQGGLWVGTGKGLVHYSSQNQWQVFDTKNSVLPDDTVKAIESDGHNGLWIGTFGGGLAHLTFGKVLSLVQDITDPDIIKTLLNDKHAAILVAANIGGGKDSLWPQTEKVANGIYSMLYSRGFLNHQIYYLYPMGDKTDFNNDGYVDKIVDGPIPSAPLQVEDVRKAFDWAKRRRPLDQPLYFFFVDHGDSNGDSNNALQLSQEARINSSEFKQLLDDYQQTTGNAVIVVIDACHSGAFIKDLTGSRFKRALISSTGDGDAYLDNGGFSSVLANALAAGANFSEAFNLVFKDKSNRFQKNLKPDRNKNDLVQDPLLLEEGQPGEWLKGIKINGSFIPEEVANNRLKIEEQISSQSLTAGKVITLQAQADFIPNDLKTAGRVTRVWAMVRPPKIDVVKDLNGTRIVAFDYVPLFRLSEPDKKNIWQTTWHNSVYNGDYEITFYAEDDRSNEVSSNPVVLTVTGGIDPPDHATVTLGLNNTQYHPGEQVTATLTENLGWGYDLYAAVLLPDNQTYVALKSLNEFAGPNRPQNWRSLQRPQNSPMTLLKDYPLPKGIPTGEYCLLGILSPEGGNVLETLGKGLSVMNSKCFQVVP